VIELTNQSAGSPIKLPSSLPIFSSSGKRQFGLFATREYDIGEKIVTYWGKHLSRAQANENRNFYMWAHTFNDVIDASESTCRGKWANNTVFYFIYLINFVGCTCIPM